MTDFKATGQRLKRDGTGWQQVSAVIHNVANDRIARSRAAEHMQKIEKVERIKD